jgi:hypothetical protein
VQASALPCSRPSATSPSVTSGGSYSVALLRCGIAATRGWPSDSVAGLAPLPPPAFGQSDRDTVALSGAPEGRTLRSLQEVGALLLSATSAYEFRCAWSVLSALLAQAAAPQLSWQAGARAVLGQFITDALHKISTWRWASPQPRYRGLSRNDGHAWLRLTSLCLTAAERLPT